VWGGGFGPFPSEENQIQGRFWGVQSFPEEEFPDVKNAEAAIEFLKQDHQKPFFMVYGLWRPHTPFTAPQKFYDMYDPEDLLIPIPGWKKDDLDDVPSWGIQLAKVWGDRFDLCGNKDPQAWRKFVLAYCACTTFADWSAGRVIEILENSQYSENTVVIFWSDNGYHCGEKNHWEKTTLWEQASLTPMAIRIPGMKTAGSTNKTPVNSLDFYPTLVDYCQLNSPPQELDGQTMRPLLEYPEKMIERVSITTYGEGFFSVRNNRYRYIQYPDGSEELYDFERDPHEFNNLANVPELKPVKESLLKSKPIKWKKSLGGKFG
jgi:arylsulfatase A-like enzyme